MTEPLEFTDRYQALGIPYPDPETMCQGDCEGTGFVPVYLYEGDPQRGWDLARPIDEPDPELVRRWREAEQREPADDGYHFVVCPQCEGTRLRPSDR